MTDKSLTAAKLSSASDKLLQDSAAAVSGSIFWGAYIILMFIALRNLEVFNQRRKEELTQARLWLIATITLMFLMSTTLWALDLASAIQQIQIELISTDGTFSSRVGKFSNMMNTRYFAQTVMFTAEIIIGDAVVVWRACALWHWNRILLSVAGVLLFSASALLTFFVGCIGYTGWHFSSHESPVCDHAQLATYVISLATNAWATGWVTYTAWKFYRFGVESGLPPQKTGSKGYQTLILIMESGWIYLLIWVSKSFTYLPLHGSPHFASGILNSIGNQIAGLYPTILIILVHQKRPVWGSPDYSHQLNLGTIQVTTHARNDLESRVEFAPRASQTLSGQLVQEQEHRKSLPVIAHSVASSSVENIRSS
ncbi:hypothetical protein D9758_000078 [Tetrapyrgos nigripes]|uniref:Uncharacterized protein n=1 Tax=Tetrapyrgos nigripes TaxID=182062 RepID=A0A8H5H176_9AGAR|nr:hypothetical protein D9758_000078 [Tetrapyrgos nigripes]